eukprot:scaffold17244_cov84-Phaeocystis_antarctica.AAC.4
MRPEEYLAHNEKLWDAIHDMLAPQAPAPLKRLPYPFRASMLALLSAELPHLVAPAAAGGGGAGDGVSRGEPLREGRGAKRLGNLIGLDTVLSIVQNAVGSAVDADAPLMEAGLDSVGAVELRSQLQQAVGESLSLPSTLIFNYPTAHQLAAYLQAPSTAARPVALLVRDQPGMESMPTALVGTSAQLPGGVQSLEAAWRMAAGGLDTVSEVPASRWALETLSQAPSAAVIRVRHGGFVVGAEWFDNRFFGISPAEAGVMDPQQRLLLERGYEALQAAGHDRDSLLGSNVGVFVGVTYMDFFEVLKASPLGQSVYASTGCGHSVASGRLSFVLGLQGPCATYDTACSATLVACHGALRALQHRECSDGLVAGASLMLVPGPSAVMTSAGMTSPHGRCHTFDDRADGYVRSEACVALALQPTSESAPVSLLGSA